MLGRACPILQPSRRALSHVVLIKVEEFRTKETHSYWKHQEGISVGGEMQKEDVRGEDEGTGAPHEVEEAGPPKTHQHYGHPPGLPS